ncbi:MAG TPA: cysteine hydrolase family protein [Sphingomicrobium sp.]|nr:cysteine hydrolase family protein [Sphingomicrobium sp.]
MTPTVPLTVRDIRGTARPTLEPSKAALIIIDAQKEYAEGKLRLEKLQPALAEITRLREWARRHHVPVIHVRQFSPAGAPIFADGSRMAEFLPEADPAPGETVVVKLYPNAFNRTTLEAHLEELGRSQLILAGFMAHMCVDSTARAGFDLDYDVFVDRSATAERAIPAPDGKIVAAADILDGTMTVLNDRFAYVVRDVAELERLAAATVETRPD